MKIHTIQIKETIVVNLTLRKQYENKLFKIIGKKHHHLCDSRVGRYCYLSDFCMGTDKENK